MASIGENEDTIVRSDFQTADIKGELSNSSVVIIFYPEAFDF